MTSYGPHHEICTLVDLLRWRARHCAKKLAYAFMTEGVETARFTYEDLDHQARVIGGFLQGMGENSSRVLLLYPPGLDYIAAFFGCLYAGATAIPSYPPRLNRPDARLQGIVNNSQASVALTIPTIRAGIERRFDHTPELAAVRWEITDQIDDSWAEKWRAPAISSDTLAFLQYTSGSTSAPKGVMVTHGNILHNERMIQQGFEHTEESIVAGWLPIYHDMGLIGNVIQPLYLGAPCYLMSPTEFLQNPYNWLKLLSDTRAHTSGGPNFAYDLCVQNITPEQRQNLDLSHWQVAFNGSEPVRAQTLERFREVFAPCGFRKEAFYPCYGLAETTLFVSGRNRSQTPVQVTSVQTDALAQNRVKAAVDGAKTQQLVSSGCGWLNEEIVIVNPETCIPCAPDEVGEIWVSGEHVAQGYWLHPQVSQTTFEATLADTAQGPYLRTGDLGFLQGGELFVTGRIKDLLIIRGRNHYPQDIELTAERSHPILRPGCGAAFSIELDGEERLVVVQEVERHAKADEIETAVAAIRQAVADQHELQAYAILLIRTGTLPKTSSGKVQRRACRDRYMEGSLTVVKGHVLETRLDSDEKTDTAPGEDLSPSEKKLVTIWTEVLRLKQVGIHDDFYALGGDSLQSARMIDLAQRAGLYLTMQQISDYHTIAELAAIASDTPAMLATQELLTGPIPVTHPQSWFLNKQSCANLNHWNVASMYETPADIRPEWAEQIVRRLLEHHDILRSRFNFDEGEWQAQIVPPGETIPFVYRDFSGLAAPQQKAAIEQAAKEIQHSLNLSTGPLIRVGLFSLGADRPTRLLIVAHHTLMDGNTMLILLDDFLTAYRQLSQGDEISLPVKTTSYREAAEWWAALAQSDEMRQEENDWLAFPWKHTPLPVDFPQPHGNTEASTRSVVTSFSIKETRALLQRVPKFYNAQVIDILLWGLVEALTHWTGGEWAQIKVVDAGQAWKREMSHFDFSRTVGLFSSDALVILNRPDSVQPAEALGSIREQLRQIPRRGLGYELLLNHSADPERRQQLASVFKGEVKLNYHGLLESPSASNRSFRQARESVGPSHSMEDARDVLLYCEAVIVRDSLNLYWLYSENFHQRASIAGVVNHFVQTLRNLIQTLPTASEQPASIEG